MKKPIALVEVGLPVDGPFDYKVPESLSGKVHVGSRVLVNFNRRRRTGYVTGLTAKSRFKQLNPILAALDEGAPSLDAKALRLTKLFKEHYGCSWGEAIETYLPKALRLRAKTNLKAPEGQGSTRPPAKKILLHDFGLNKRWEHILGMIEAHIKENRSVIFLVPEKSYLKAIEEHLKNYAALLRHLEAKVSQDEESQRWQQLKTGAPYIVLGARSAVFAALKDVGLIIIFDEEHSAYKQDQSPHYHAHDVALLRSMTEDADCLFVSSCPSAEIVHEAKGKGWQMITLEDNLPGVQLIDMRNYNPKQTSRLSYPLQNQLDELIKKGGRALLFMNRRGFSTLTRCNQCGHTLSCPHCNTSLTFMHAIKKLACRHCTYQIDLPKICPACNGSYLRSVGMGIEKLESEIARFFPEARVVHYDKETAVVPSTANVILATQALMKERETLKLDLAAILSFDALLNQGDFRSAQRSFAHAVHLAQMTRSRLVVQSRNTGNYCIEALKKWDFKKFYIEELKLRRELQYPPFSHLLLVLIRGKKEETVVEQARALYEIITKKQAKGIDVLEPNADFMPKLRDQYRYTIMLKGKNLKALLTLAKGAIKALKKKGVLITLNVDP